MGVELPAHFLVLFQKTQSFWRDWVLWNSGRQPCLSYDCLTIFNLFPMYNSFIAHISRSTFCVSRYAFCSRKECDKQVHLSFEIDVSQTCWPSLFAKMWKFREPYRRTISLLRFLVLQLGYNLLWSWLGIRLDDLSVKALVGASRQMHILLVWNERTFVKWVCFWLTYLNNVVYTKT